MLFAIPNLSASTAFEVEPWTFHTEIPETALSSKASFVAWGQKPTTKNCYFSAAEGQDPLQRVSTDNPVVYLHGLIVDYDAPCDVETLEKLRDNCPVEFTPNWASLTYSKGARLVWLFQSPIPILNRDTATSFLKIAYQKLKLNKMLPGFDEKFFEPHQYYERGREWVNLANDRIPNSFTHQWMFQAGNRVKWETEGPSIPMNVIAEEVKARFPGVWKGPFEEGNRGTRFWDPTAKNETAAVIRSTGMQCFTGFDPFVSWREIFGNTFIEKYEADHTGKLIADTFYDGHCYWFLDAGGRWTPTSREDFRLMLKVKYDLSTSVKRKETASEVDKVLYAVHEHKTVSHALPFIHCPSGTKYFNGEKYLNTSTLQCMEPAKDGATAWGDGFPWLAHFFNDLFHPHEQLDYFLAWWTHFYRNAYLKEPRQGQATFVAGMTGMGKTLLTTGIVAPTVGGMVDASAFLLGQGNFNSHVISSPIMAIDDALCSSDARTHNKYSAMLKKIVANQHIMYEEKFMKPGLVEWLGRVMVTCNLDSESMRIFPNSELSMLDKICLFKCATREKNFPPDKDIKKILARELPFMCKFLLEWTIPDHCIGTNRFGIESYHESTLHAASLQTTASFSFLELLLDFLTSYVAATKGTQDMWRGTSTNLLSEMLNDLAIAPIAAKYAPSQIASMLGQLKSRGYPIENARTATKREWIIPTDLMNTEVTHEH